MSQMGAAAIMAIASLIGGSQDSGGKIATTIAPDSEEAQEILEGFMDMSRFARDPMMLTGLGSMGIPLYPTGPMKDWAQVLGSLVKGESRGGGVGTPMEGLMGGDPNSGTGGGHEGTEGAGIGTPEQAPNEWEVEGGMTGDESLDRGVARPGQKKGDKRRQMMAKLLAELSPEFSGLMRGRG